MPKTKTEEFEEWLAEAVHLKASRSRKEPEDVFSSVLMLDAKLNFMDGLSPLEYSLIIDA